jgi:hypothetical protein
MKISLQAKAFLLFITVLIVHGLFFIHTAYADVSLTPITIDTTLDATQTYDVVGSITVMPGVTLTIPAGTHFLLGTDSALIVQGTLAVKGTTAHHVVFSYGNPPPYIPLNAPLKTPNGNTQTPDDDATQSPDTTDVVTNTVMMGTDATVDQYHYGIWFDNNGTGTISYADISGGLYGLIISKNSSVTASHTTISNCTTGILGTGGTLHLTSSSFTNVQYPADWDFHGSFTHSGSTFSNTGIKGWRYGGDILPGETMRLNSTDGEYTIPSVTVPKGNSLIISAGVTVFFADGNGEGVEVEGTFTANGTADKPITFYGDGICNGHTPIISFNQTTTAVIGHADFKNLCGGITATHSTVTLTNDTFTTIAASAITGNDYGIIHASNITMNDVYQALNVGIIGNLTLSNTSITLVNGPDPAIAVTEQTPFSGNTISVDTASTCVGVSGNSSITVSNMTLSHCTVAGIVSEPIAITPSPTGFTMTDSEISDSGTAMQLDNAILTNVSNDKFDGNKVGVSLKDMPATTIINNWWGSNSGPTIDSNPDGTGDSIVTSNVVSVTYRPWIGMTAAPERNPIIIVPGITGSVLDKQYGDKSEIWPAIASLALSPTDSFLNDLELQSDGSVDPARPMGIGDIIRSAPGTDVFDGLIAALLQSGYREGIDLFVMPYDWRLSNSTNQALLGSTIANALQTSGKTKVTIIAHSMGGLLVKDYLAKNTAAPIDHLFFIASPNLGAPKAFKALMYGDDMGFNFSVTPSINIHVLNPDRIKVITQNMPSVYELLPSKKYIDAIGSYVAQGTFLDSDQTMSLLKNSGRNASLFPVAETLHDDTDNLDLSKDSTYNFIGCGATKTIGKIFLTKKEVLTATGMQLTDSYRLQYVAGDGTVPRDSAKDITGATNYFTNAGSHGTLPSTGPVKTAIVDILQGITPDTSGTSLTSSPACALSGDVVEVHSPVTLDIYDDQGNHTGPTADGDIEFGIPNVDYETIGDDKFAFLPTGPTYTIVNHALAGGSYDMYISHSADDDTVTHESYFHNIPLASADTVGMVTIKPGDTNYSISLDSDGDGATDATITPSSNLTTAQAADITPPVTKGTYSNGSVALSATDDNSGVLDTQYSMDDITWNTYKNPFTAVAGVTIHYFSTDNAGNVEDIQSLVIPQQTATQTAASTSDTATPSSTTNTTAPTENNNYYYDGGTTITNPPTSDSDNDSDSNAENSPNADQVSDDTSPDATVPETPDQPEDAPSATPDTNTPQTFPDASNPDTVSNSHSTQNPATLAAAVRSGGVAVAKKLLVPAQLVATVANSVPVHTSIFYLVIGVCCVIYIIFIRKRYSKKKKQDHIE